MSPTLKINLVLMVIEAANATPFRFSKHGINGMEYPPNEEAIEQLKTTKAVSVRTFSHSQVQESLNFMDKEDKRSAAVVQRKYFKDFPKTIVSHPDDTITDANFNFWTEFDEVVKAQILRKEGFLTKDIMTVHPLFNSDEPIKQSAFRVKADFPTYFPTRQIMRFLKNDTHPLKLDTKITNVCNSGKEFVNQGVALAEIIGWAIRTVSPVAFALKWHHGRARPEEVAKSIYLHDLKALPTPLVGSMPNGIYEDIVQDLKTLNLGDNATTIGWRFTRYAKEVTGEGSPMHPSYPAMHSAASSISSWLDVLAILSEEQREEIRLLDYSISYFRTLAGVHYESDNRAGLRLGQVIIKKTLPHYLADRFKCNSSSYTTIKKYVEDKVRRLNQDHPLNWNEWVPPFWKNPKEHDYFKRRRLNFI